MPAITSKANARIKEVRALRNRRERDRTGVFLAESATVVREALNAAAGMEAVLYVEDRLGADEGELLSAARESGIELIEVSAEVYDSVSFRGDPDSVAAVVRKRRDALPESPSDELSWVAVHDIQHPGNLGTLIRTSDAAGGAGVILSGKSTDPYHPVAVRGSLGAVFSQRIVETTQEEFAAWAKRYGAQVAGTSPQGSVDYRDAAYRRPVVVLSGNERIGLTPAQIATCDILVRVPMAGVVDSLNLSVATALVLYEVYRQHRA